MAVRNRLAAFIDQYLNYYMRNELINHQNDLVGQRQREASRAALTNNLLERVKQDPSLAARLQGAGMSQIGGIPLSPFIPTQEENLGSVAKTIESAKDLASLPTQVGLERAYGALPGANGKDPRPIEDLVRERSEREAFLRANMAPEKVEGYNPNTGAKETKFLPGDPRRLTGQTVQTSPTTAQSIAATNATEAGTRGEKVKTAGAEAGAQAAAQFPFQMRLATARANISLKRQQEYDEWKQTHPMATAQERNKASNAITAIGSIGEARQLLDYLDKKGVVGAVEGRIAQVAAGKIKDTDLVKALVGDGLTDEDARIAANYFSSIKLLSSLAAVTHGGARGGGSVELTKQFQQMLSPVGDRPIIEGQLDALERLMNHYKEHPDQPTQFDLHLPSTQPEANPALDSFRNKVSQLGGGGL